jgi:HK97 family phage prohead protease
MRDTSFIFSSGPLELKAEGENFFVEGYISTSDLDLVNDIVTKACMLDMAEQMKSRTIKFDVEHESFRGKDEFEMELNKTIIPVAKVDDFVVDKKGLKVRAMLNDHASRFDEVKGSIEGGFLDAFSIAYIPVKSAMEMRNGQEIRLLDKVNLLNVAFTGNPINTESMITTVFAKSLQYLKDKELKKSYNHGSDNQLNKEVKTMSEEENKKPEEGSESDEPKEPEKEEPEKKDEEPKEPGKPEEPKEPKEPGEGEEKENPEVKALKEDVNVLKKELAEVKALLKKPLVKSKVDQKDKSGNFEEKSRDPLDLIA